MHFLTVSLFLSLFLVTQAIDLSSELNQPSLSESVYIFAVTSDAPIDEIKASFAVTGSPRQSFRVIGENTYYFVLASNSTTALRHLTFPNGSSVTQYPVEHVADYAKMFGFDSGYEENDTGKVLPDTVLAFDECDLDFSQRIPVKLFDLMISGFGEKLLATHEKVKLLIYECIAFYPKKVLFFWAVHDNAHRYFVKNLQDFFGGIGVMVSKTKRVVKI